MAGLDESLHARLSSIGVTDVRPLAGGASSLTYRGRLEQRDVVVKVAPPGVAPIAHRDVLRQARAIKALEGSGIPVPEILLEDLGEPPEIPPLFVMSLLGGASFEPLFDIGDVGVPGAVVTARFERAAAVLGELHRLPPDAIGLADEPVVGAVDEIERWSRTLQRVDPNLVAGWEDVRAMLEQSAPPSNARALVHGDYRLGNLLAEEDRITAVIDWEIWSVSDPRIDLGWFLANCDPRTYDRGSRYAGDVPPREELVARYRGAGGPDVDAVPWFQALACFKSTATWSLIVKHNRRRATPDPAWEAMAPVLPGLLRRATEFLSA